MFYVYLCSYVKFLFFNHQEKMKEYVKVKQIKLHLYVQ